jgi:hypothetical protein
MTCQRWRSGRTLLLQVLDALPVVVQQTSGMAEGGAAQMAELDDAPLAADAAAASPPGQP